MGDKQNSKFQSFEAIQQLSNEITRALRPHPDFRINWDRLTIPQMRFVLAINGFIEDLPLRDKQTVLQIKTALAKTTRRAMRTVNHATSRIKSSLCTESTGEYHYNKRK